MTMLNRKNNPRVQRAKRLLSLSVVDQRESRVREMMYDMKGSGRGEKGTAI